MPRPVLTRRVFSEPGVAYFKPAGVRMAGLKEIALKVEEFEALRLKDLEEMEQERAAESMGISQPTFCRLVSLARKKVADAIVNGKAIRVEGGNFEVVGGRKGSAGRRMGRGM